MSSSSPQGFTWAEGQGVESQPSLDTPRPRLPLRDIARCNHDAQRDGLYTGLSAGLISAAFGHRTLRLSANNVLFAGFLTGGAAGYLCARFSLQSRLARLESQLIMVSSSDRSSSL